jgi:hypothetical protein
MSRGLRIVLFLLLFAASTVEAQLETKYDRFQNRTELFAHGPITVAGPNINFSSTYDGQRPAAEPQYVIIGYAFTNEKPEFAQCHRVAFLADGKHIPVAETKYNITHSYGHAIEMVGSLVPFKAARKMTRATVVESQVCRTELRFTKLDRDNLRAVVEAASPPTLLPRWLLDWFE